MKTDRYILLYQCGLANVFREGPGHPLQRLLQHAYSPCEWYCRGLQEAGHSIDVMHCDKAGDMALLRDEWATGKGELWADEKHGVRSAR